MLLSFFLILNIQVSTFEDFIPDMKQFVSKLQERTSLRNAIVVEQVNIILESFELEETFKGHVVQLPCKNRNTYSRSGCSELCPA